MNGDDYFDDHPHHFGWDGEESDSCLTGVNSFDHVDKDNHDLASIRP